jgi:hypothetical protein
LKEISKKLSELGATSDRFERNHQKAVRTRCNFGQVWRKSVESCPNQEQLRTGLEEISKKLSEPKMQKTFILELKEAKPKRVL